MKNAILWPRPVSLSSSSQTCFIWLVGCQLQMLSHNLPRMAVPQTKYCVYTIFYQCLDLLHTGSWTENPANRSYSSHFYSYWLFLSFGFAPFVGSVLTHPAPSLSCRCSPHGMGMTFTTLKAQLDGVAWYAAMTWFNESNEKNEAC